VFFFFCGGSGGCEFIGQTLEAGGRPAFDGDELARSVEDGMSGDEKAFHKMMAIMFPIRNALMYDIADLSQDKWDELIAELSKRGIKETSSHPVRPQKKTIMAARVFSIWPKALMAETFITP
jgi:hypothetical protein